MTMIVVHEISSGPECQMSRLALAVLLKRAGILQTASLPKLVCSTHCVLHLVQSCSWQANALDFMLHLIPLQQFTQS